jgi:hypothetical protein
VCGSRCGIIADRGEFEYRMPVCLGNEGCDWGVDRRGEVWSRGACDPDVSLEDRSGFFCRHRSNRVGGPLPRSIQLTWVPGRVFTRGSNK